jgi:hypothetical protein
MLLIISMLCGNLAVSAPRCMEGKDEELEKLRVFFMVRILDRGQVVLLMATEA